MHVISRKPFADAMKKYPNDANAIATVYRILKLGSFTNPEQLRAVFKSLDNFKYRDKWWVIDIGGNNLRLLAFIEFKHQRLYVKHIITHAEYEELCRKYRN
ncbi:MAG: type II toxin-antitoxin system HigB family toxin [Idiomarina sp.]|nr:type II toxin-antitoxin system HigB family toxin [Idiomarina sp.]